MEVVKRLLWILIGSAIVLILFGFYRTYEIQKWPEQNQFLSGKLPSPSPDGFYRGSQNLSSRTSWQGKTFFAASSTGINRFGDEEKYPFQTSTGAGVRDRGVQVMKIDYQSKDNPFWIRPVLDEIVEVSPEHYLGKVHYRIIPGHPFTIGYFRLQK